MNVGIILLTGLVFGLGGVLLVKFGNPGNYGFCAACQLRDIAGALGIHSAATLQYVRPEILGWVLGAFGIAKFKGEFVTRGGSNPFVRFVLGIVMMLGALAFLGCPLRAILRLAAGDLNGLTALAGFASGIGVGIFFLKNGYNLGRAKTYQGMSSGSGYLVAIGALVLLVGVSVHAGFLNFSSQGPGSMHAPIAISLVLGLASGMLAQRARMCLSGGVRDFMLVRDTYLLKIYGVMFLAAMLGNLYFGFFKLGFTGQPLAHTMHLWNFLGLFLVGIAATLAGGCPLRQLIMAAEGSIDGLACVLGMLVGAGIAHTMNAAGAPVGLAMNGQIAVVLGIVVACLIGFLFRKDIMPVSKGAGC